MKFVTNKKACSFVSLAFCSYVILKLYSTVHLRVKNTKSVENGEHVLSYNILKKHRDNLIYENNVKVIKSNLLSDTGDSSPQKNGIQMSAEQISSIKTVLPPSGNLLVWGLGNDSPHWHNSTDGKVIFIEDDFPSRKAGIQWYDKIMQKFPFLEAYKAHYKTHTIKSFSKYVNNPNSWHELDLCDQLPAAITRTHWHVIIVDAPLGCCGRGPGRYQSIYTSWKLAKKGTHIFVDDFERKVEHELSMNIFGKPLEVIKRQNTMFSKANEQAHFIIKSENVFARNTNRVSTENGTDSDNIKETILDNIDNKVNNWSLLLTVNNGFFDFFNNWRLHFLKLNISLPVYVIAEDNMVYNKLINIKNSGMEIQRSEHISINTSVHYNSNLYKEMVSTRPSYILSLLRKGINILYADIDSVWLKNPFPYLIGKFDIWSQMDLKSHNIYCTGFLAIRSNVNTISFISRWHEALKERPSLNQPVFNELLHKSSILKKALDSRYFPSGKQYFEQFTEDERSNVVVVHNNWIIGHDKKLKRFKTLNLWLNGT